MRPFFKKGLSVLLAAMLLFGSVAVGSEGAAEWLGALAPKAQAASEDDLFFSLNSDGSYCVLGYSTAPVGAFVIPSTYSGLPVTSIGEFAFYGCTDLTSITIPNSITSIGGYAFEYCTELTGITIPDGVASIGYGAFSYCTGLTSVTIPDSVTTIRYGAFACCTDLESITVAAGNTVYDSRNNCNAIIETKSNTLIAGCKNTVIPNGVESIGYAAFQGCTGLTSITIPDSVESIGDCAFFDCTGLTSVTIPASVMVIGDDALPSATTVYCYDGSAAHQYAKANGNPVVLLDEGLTPGESDLTFSLNDDGESYSVSGCNSSARGALTIPSVYNGKPVTSIGSYAFYYCTGLTSITIPDSVTNIGDYAFSGCAGLTSITIPNNVTNIGDYTFYSCTELTSITIPDKVESIGEFAFFHCTGLTSITIPNSVTSIGVDAFSDCTGLTSITIPNSVTSIERYAFSRCTGLESITVAAGNTVYDSRNNCNAIIETASNTLIAGCKNTVIPNSVESIGYAAFFGCTGLTSITIPNSVTSIEYYAFGDCTGLTSVTIPNSVESIGGYAFCGCTGLTSITIPNSVTSIWYSAFEYCTGLTSITIPDSVTSIGDCAFYGCTGLMSISIPASVMVIGDDALPSATTVYCYDGSAAHQYAQANGNPVVLLDAGLTPDETDLTFSLNDDGESYSVSGCNESASGALTIPSVYNGKPVTNIGNGAFSRCTGLTSVTIPNSVTSIGEWAFSGCTGLTSITIPNSVTSIGDYAFYGCTGLTSITIPDSVESIGNYAFFNCTSLTSITISNSVESIGDYAFFGCAGLTSISVAAGNTVYDSRNNCNAINKTASNTLIYGCKNTTIPNSVTSIGNYAFYNCTGLTSITILNSVESIGMGAFYGCTGLTSITIPNSVTSIGMGAFYGCTGLMSISIPDSVTSIGESVLPSATTVYCYDGSAAQQYAQANGNSVVLLDTVFTPSGTFAVQKGTNFITGLTAGTADFAAGFTLAEGYSVIAPSASTRVGTGDEIKIVDANGFTVATCEIVLFGDINGDSWYDGTDAYFVYLVANGMISADGLTAAQRAACDTNHDGIINADDAKLIEKAGILLNNINQNAAQEELNANSAYIEYCGVIDQMVEPDEITPDSDPVTNAQPEPQTTVQSILGWFRMVFTIVLNWLLRIS